MLRSVKLMKTDRVWIKLRRPFVISMDSWRNRRCCPQLKTAANCVLYFDVPLRHHLLRKKHHYRTYGQARYIERCYIFHLFSPQSIIIVLMKIFGPVYIEHIKLRTIALSNISPIQIIDSWIVLIH